MGRNGEMLALAGVAASASDDALLPYVPRLVVDWLSEHPGDRYHAVSGTGVFADISGFTNLTERLARRGRAGAEEMGDLINGLFDPLLTAAYNYGANLLKWGGDAVLLLFDGGHHANRACQAAWAMQQVIRGNAELTTSQGKVRIGMSIGVHSGEFDFVLAGSRFRELVVTGPAASVTASMEKAAARGQIMVSPGTAALLPRRCTAKRSGAVGLRLIRPPETDLAPNRQRKRAGVSLDAAFCSQLLEHLSSGRVEHEHRHVAVGFIEFTGSDRYLVDHSPDQFAEAVDGVVTAAQEAAADNDVTFLATDISEDGGKIILVAGAPTSYGDDETRLISAVKRVVDGGGPLSLRAGVSSGKVFAGDYGPSYRKAYSLNGDIVNLAARLMGSARPGQVIASPETVKQSRTRFDTEALPPLTLKGKRDPVAAVLVRDAQRLSAPSSASRLPLIGRDSELSVLVGALDQARRGCGQVIEIVGPAGMGKSRLIDELAERSGSRVLRADGDLYESSTPYYPLQRLFRWTLGLPLDAEDAVVGSALTELVSGTAPDLLPLLPLIGIVVGVDLAETPEVETLDTAARKNRLEAATSEVLGRLLRDPIILVLNDIHFMDDATLGLLGRMAADVKTRPWLLISTRRPEFASPLDRAPDLIRLELQPLPDDATRRLVAAATELHPMPGHRVQQLTDRAGGNPLFLLELAAGASSGNTDGELPSTVEAVIASRIDRLDAPHRRWLRAASVIGESVDPALLDEMLRGARIDAQPVADLSEFITVTPDGPIRFNHGLIRQAAYDGLPFRRRSELHAIVARALQRRTGHRSAQDEALLSVHCSRGGRYADAWKYSRRAGDRARRQYALTDAIDCYARAIEAAAKLSSRKDSDMADVYEAMADVHGDLGEIDAADEALRMARRRAGGDELRTARLGLKAAILRQRTGRYRDALTWLSRSRTILAAATGPEAGRLRADTATTYSVVKYRQGDYRTCSSWARRALIEADAGRNARSRAGALEMLALSAATAGWPWDDSDFVTALSLYEDIKDLRAKATCLNRYGCAAYFSGRWSQAVELFAAAEETYLRIGREEDGVVNGANRAEVLIDQGRITEALPVLEATIRVCRAVEATSSLAFCLGLLGRAQMTQGDLESAATTLAHARQLSDSLGERSDVQRLDILMAECTLRLGRPGRALAATDAVVARDGVVAESSPNAPLFHRVRGEALLRSRRRTAGVRELRMALLAAQQRESKPEVAAVLRLLLANGAESAEHEARAWRSELESLEATLDLVEGQPAEPSRAG